MTTDNDSALEPLKGLLGSLLIRLDAIECQLGIPSSALSGGGTGGVGGSTQKTPTTPKKTSKVVIAAPTIPVETESASPAVIAYDEHMTRSVTPLVEACNGVDDGALQNMGDLIKNAWSGVRGIIVLASMSKMPQPPTNIPTELQPHLKPIQDAVSEINKLRLDRKYDQHCKAVKEMMGAISWILIRPPPQTPASFVKEANDSSLFWTNKIRKEFKGKDEKQITFCDAIRNLLSDLVSYITEHHKTGLEWNPKGISLAEAVLRVAAAAEQKEAEKEPAIQRPQIMKQLSIQKKGGAGGMSTLMNELANKQSADGSSAATGLKHVTRDQQTWRKEFKGPKSSEVPGGEGTTAAAGPATAATTATTPPRKKSSGPKLGLPICEYQDRGHKWVVENQTKETSHNAPIVIEVSDPKQQVYVYNCYDTTVQVQGGKCKSVIMDTCTKCNLVFETVISGCEIVNCKKVQVQTTGVTPSISIDKTDGCLVYLSKDTVSVTNFVTSTSTEMNVSYPDENDEHKEMPIPEQFVHKLLNGAVTSNVSDLYH